MDSARTVSIVSCGWNRMPPLPGPRASLCCTRKPRKTFTIPSSMRTGIANWYSRRGYRRRSLRGRVKPQVFGYFVELGLRDLK